MKSNRADGERTLAVFIDFENVGLGFGGRRDRFSIEKVLERLVEKGKIVAKKAYADWSRFAQYAGSLHSAAVELVEIPKRSQTGKNSADIRMCVDAMDLAYSKEHIDTFVIVSGDSDFSPLVSKLKELGKHVIGLGLVDSTSDLLRDNCDEFLYYEDLDRAPAAPLADNQAIPETKRKAFALLLDSLLALRRENKEVIFSSMVKDTMKRKKPSFNEEYHGYRTFSDLLEDAQRFGLLDLERHKTSGTYVVTRFGSEPRPGSAATPLPRPQAIPQPPARQPAPARPQPPIHQPAPTKPPAKEPAPARGGERRGGRRPAPEKPTPAPAPPKGRDDNDRLPLGKELIDDIDLDENGGDDVPSYMPRKGAPPTAKPAKPAQQPAGRSGRAAKPAAPARPKAEGKPAQPPARGRSQPSRRAEEPKPRPKAEPKPAPPADEDAEFGAGLDL
ncbi:MAG TPA: NYN domain-containing protein [Fimbriiglobus sp.]|nr:NYN domain-containing protein [Fimbriiglobus sp.]